MMQRWKDPKYAVFGGEAMQDNINIEIYLVCRRGREDKNIGVQMWLGKVYTSGDIDQDAIG